nr:unnamed protein product [Callosobruchus analis]
MTYWSM